MTLPPSAKKALVVAALALILPVTKHFEGLRYVAYPDPAHGWAVPTICYGHTKGVRQGDTATQTQCDKWLEEDMADAMDVVLRHAKVALSPAELAAYADFVFNVGEPKFRSSTLLRKMNAGSRDAACDELLRWIYAGGVRLPGLERRRYAVNDICHSRP